MSDKAELLIFGRQVEPDWQTRIEAAQRELREYIAELEAERLELRKILGWAYELEDYEDSDITHWMPLPESPEVQE